MARKALITGITGQDGSYLAELLLDKGYEVHGLIRRASSFNTARIDHLYQDAQEERARLFLHYGDLTDGTRLATLLERIDPLEVYNLAAQSHVRVSFDEPEYTGDATGLGTIRLLEAIRSVGLQCRSYQASSSEMFGGTAPRRTKTPRSPRSRPTARPRCTRTGSPATIARATACSRSTASCSTTSGRAGGRPSSLVRSPGPPPESPRGSSMSCGSATSTRCATGVEAIESREVLQTKGFEQVDGFSWAACPDVHEPVYRLVSRR